MAYDELIAKLETATEGSRELDGEIALAVVRENYPDAHFVDEESKDVIQVMPGMTAGASSELPRYTTSLDAALLLVPEEFGWLVRSQHDGLPFANCSHPYSTNNIWIVNGENVSLPPEDQGHNHARAQTPAIALCIAALKARAAQDKT
jgi:hypothetical protein